MGRKMGREITLKQMQPGPCRPVVAGPLRGRELPTNHTTPTPSPLKPGHGVRFRRFAPSPPQIDPNPSTAPPHLPQIKQGRPLPHHEEDPRPQALRRTRQR